MTFLYKLFLSRPHHAAAPTKLVTSHYHQLRPDREHALQRLVMRESVGKLIIHFPTNLDAARQWARWPIRARSCGIVAVGNCGLVAIGATLNRSSFTLTMEKQSDTKIRAFFDLTFLVNFGPWATINWVPTKKDLARPHQDWVTDFWAFASTTPLSIFL